MSGFSEQEKAFFRKQQGGGNSRLKVAGYALAALLVGGVSLDALNGFYFIRTSKTPLLSFLGLIVLGVIFLLGEIVSDWINSKDKKANPLYVRAFNLVLLIGAAGVIVCVGWYVLSLLG